MIEISDEEILRRAAEINQRKFGEMQKILDEEKRQREKIAAELKEQKLQRKYNSIVNRYKSMTTEGSFYQVDMGYKEPVSYEGTIIPGREWDSRTDSFEESEGESVLDLDAVDLEYELNDIGNGQRVRITIELLPPLDYEEWKEKNADG